MFSKLSILLIFCIFIYSSSFAADPPDFKFGLTNPAAAQQYSAALRYIRNNPATTSFLQTTRRLTGDSRDTFILHLTDTENVARPIYLVIRQSDLYVIGFYNFTAFYLFNEVPDASYNLPAEITADTPTIRLNFNSSYAGARGLESTAHQGRDEVEFSLQGLRNDIHTLYAADGQENRNLARALLRLIVAFMEGARFADIETRVRQALFTFQPTAETESERRARRLTLHEVNLTNGWSALSEGMIRLSQDPNYSFSYNDFCFSSTASLISVIALMANINTQGASGGNSKRSTKLKPCSGNSFLDIKTLSLGSEYKVVLKFNAVGCSLKYDASLNAFDERNAKVDCKNPGATMLFKALTNPKPNPIQQGGYTIEGEFRAEHVDCSLNINGDRLDRNGEINSIFKCDKKARPQAFTLSTTDKSLEYTMKKSQTVFIARKGMGADCVFQWDARVVSNERNFKVDCTDDATADTFNLINMD